MEHIDLEDWHNYSDAQKEIMIKLLEIKERLNLIDFKLLNSLNRTENMLDKLQPSNEIKND